MVKSQQEYHILAVKRAVQLINLFAEHGPSLGVSEIAKLMGIHKSVVHKILVTLESEDWVHKSSHTDKYSLGLTLLKLFPLVPNRFNIRSIARSIMEELVAEVEETATLTILSPDCKEGICIEKVECTHNVRLTTEIGSRIPLHAGATGRILASFMGPEKIEELLVSDLAQYTEKTITDPKRLLEDISVIRKQGYDITFSQVDHGLVAISAPIFNSSDKLAAGLSISGPQYRFQPQEKVEYLIQKVKSAARRITHNLKAANMEKIT